MLMLMVLIFLLKKFEVIENLYKVSGDVFSIMHKYLNRKLMLKFIVMIFLLAE